MTFFCETDTFKDVYLREGKKPLVICDIDNTFIRPKHNYNYYYNLLKPDFPNKDDLDDEINEILNASINIGIIKDTDIEGFYYLLERVLSLGGKLIFLTARSSVFHERTVRHLGSAGLINPEHYEIHYTNNKITKGEYIRQNNLLEGFDQHIFIDDYPSYLISASEIYPEMDCYLFCYRDP